MTDGAKGTIWASGLHRPSVNGKPTKLYVPKETIPKTFQLFKEEITRNGGIKLGIDHIPEHLYESYPFLKKLNLDDVGKITEVRSDGERIYATKSEHTNPLIAELYARGDLPAYSIVSSIKTSPCPSGKADLILRDMNDIKRTDYVDEGACTACKVGNVPDDMILTAKLSMEEEIMTEPIKEPVLEPVEPVEPEPTEPVVEPQADPEPEPEPPEPVVAEPLTVDSLKGMLGDFKEEVTTLVSDLVKGETQKVEAKLATMKEDTTEMKLEAKKAVVGSKIDAKIKEGYLKPAMRDGLLEAGLAMEEKAFDNHLSTYDTKVWEDGQRSHFHLEEGSSEYTKEDFENDYKKAYGTKPGA